jgi:spore cortex formation protein SpoVR/YcgB (stage V sporulation)
MARKSAKLSRVAAKPLFTGSDWNFKDLARCYDAIQDVALNDLRLEVYPNQIEIISSEQMLDAYASIGMPLMYRHWSFGKRFARDEHLYRKGYSSLAYEIVINSNPCVSYLMEDNTMAMHALVMAHAAFGHNHFFKNNYAFRQWTDAGGILDYLDYAKKYVTRCEERHGLSQVERLLDAAHALLDHGVFRYRRPAEPLPAEVETRQKERREFEERTFDPVMHAVAKPAAAAGGLAAEVAEANRAKALGLPEENLIYFLERHSPILEEWQREILKIARDIAQYFYPQRQTKVMNEGCATFVHHYIANALYDRGQLPEGAMLEILHSHSSVVAQPTFNDPRYSGLNPYALGFRMMQDIARIARDPTDEDKEWFPQLAGCGEWRAALKDAWANYRDESFIRQYLSPHLMRDLKLFVLFDDASTADYLVSEIHDERGYHRVREALANSYDPGITEPDIQVIDADLRGQRQLRLKHRLRDGVPLDEKDRKAVVDYIQTLWGYEVSLLGVEEDTGTTAYEVRSG